MIVRRPTALLLASLLSLGASVAINGPARAVTTWRSRAQQCTQPDGLQACIDKTSHFGDTIELTQDPSNSQFGSITHSLTVKPRRGSNPTLGHLEVDDKGSAAMAVDIEDVSSSPGFNVHTFRRDGPLTGGQGTHVTGSSGRGDPASPDPHPCHRASR